MRSTYRYLRLSMPLLGLVLATAVIIQIFSTQPRCWLGSISAYYYTPARAVFVAALCAIGTALVVFKASTTRADTALNLAGVGAFALALVPTPLKTIADDSDFEKCSRSNEPTSEQLSAALNNNVLTLVIGITVLAAAFWVCRVVIEEGHGQPNLRSVVAATVLSAVVWVGYVWWHTADVSVRTVEKIGHSTGTVCLFVGISFIIVAQLWPRLAVPRGTPRPPRSEGVYLAGYWASFAVLILGAVIFVPLWLADKANGLFWFETTMISAFVLFWTLQTIEDWGLD
ncbi:hypothetical protein [Nocardioides sp. MH1]|uniref:hypothetical protein n=1 Tax=Nocardioides sp. MH1 TaxID=3242490 RepID=UPI003521CD73